MNGVGMAKKTNVKATGQIVKVEGCEEIELALRNSRAIEKFIVKSVEILEAVDVQGLKCGDKDAMNLARLGIQYSKGLVEIHKFHVGVQTKTLEATNETEFAGLLDGKTDEEVLAMIQELESGTGEVILDAEAEEVHDDRDDG